MYNTDNSLSPAGELYDAIHNGIYNVCTIKSVHNLDDCML